MDAPRFRRVDPPAGSQAQRLVIKPDVRTNHFINKSSLSFVGLARQNLYDLFPYSFYLPPCICIQKCSSDSKHENVLLLSVRGGPFLCTVFPICTRCKLGWVGGLKNVGCANYVVKNDTYTQKLQFFFKFLFQNNLNWFQSPNLTFFLTNLQESMRSLETYHLPTPGVRIFFSHLCKLRGGWVGQSEFAHCAN